MWNERYASDEYIYGTEPNSFLLQNAKALSGPVLSIAEGEGRNAVFLASLGLEVTGVDGSEVGLAKAQNLAKAKGVKISTVVSDLATFEPAPECYSSVISIFAHLPSDLRKVLYPRLERSLRPGGIVLLESYSEAQLARATGGPKDVDMLMSKAKIEKEFSNYEILLLKECEREVNEGSFHSGLASVVQFIGRRKASL
ncbi:MAG: class I SAM-dependent methyltransferase [Oligoflexia bacterium]|nr:class I SAM-dependent methyltransferase [Oligoflexia bacterium]